MMLSTNDKSAQTEAACLSELVKKGYKVLLPFGVERYDLVVDSPQRGFLKAQCKTGQLKDGVVRFHTTTYTSSRGRKAYAEEEVDIFLVYCAETDKVYWLEWSMCGTSATPHLRIDPPKNNQTTGVRWAKDFEVQGAMV
jgi:hypothetical protein